MEDLSCWQEKFKVCIYAKRLINKIEYLNTEVEKPVSIEEVKKAIYYARKYHGLQMRQSGEPYYSHPLEVAYMVAEYTVTNMQDSFRTDMIVTSILHDTIEDTALSKEKITEAFGEQVANQVQDLTRVKEYGKISSAEMIEMLYEEQKLDMLLIKLFDRLHNMQTINAKSPEKIQKTVQETISRFLSLSIYFKLDNIVQILLEIQSNITQEQKDYEQYYDRFQLPSLILQSKIPPVHIRLS
ncbi:HD domain-containing protein [Candidatus Rickettsia kedanie]|uniref:HD domain-containing protein n=1 Tax=Candidatus Rickettsia kedanie TaxID=3115352 RepID=A0ABP9TV10_9RICK